MMSAKKVPVSGKEPNTEKVLDKDTEAVPPVEPVEPDGLIVRGAVMRRSRRFVGEKQTEVVTYIIGPRLVTVEVWEPNGEYAPLGEQVCWPVVPNVWQGRVTFRVDAGTEEF
jgi:hypothetical protein